MKTLKKLTQKKHKAPQISDANQLQIAFAEKLLNSDNTPQYYIYPDTLEDLAQRLQDLKSAITHPKSSNVEEASVNLTYLTALVGQQVHLQSFLRTEMAERIQQINTFLADNETLPTDIRSSLVANRENFYSAQANRTFIGTREYIKLYGALLDSKELMKKTSTFDENKTPKEEERTENKCPPAQVVPTQTVATTASPLRIRALKQISAVAKLDLAKQTLKIQGCAMQLIKCLHAEECPITAFRKSVEEMEGLLNPPPQEDADLQVEPIATAKLN